MQMQTKSLIEIEQEAFGFPEKASLFKVTDNVSLNKANNFPFALL